jgi:hypothetical protein
VRREPVLYGNGRDDDSRAIRLLFNGFSVLDARLEVDILADGVGDLLPGLYRLKVPSRWPLDPRHEGYGRRAGPQLGPRQPVSV